MKERCLIAPSFQNLKRKLVKDRTLSQADNPYKKYFVFIIFQYEYNILIFKNQDYAQINYYPPVLLRLFTTHANAHK